MARRSLHGCSALDRAEGMHSYHLTMTMHTTLIGLETHAIAGRPFPPPRPLPLGNRLDAGILESCHSAASLPQMLSQPLPPAFSLVSTLAPSIRYGMSSSRPLSTIQPRVLNHHTHYLATSLSSSPAVWAYVHARLAWLWRFWVP